MDTDIFLIVYEGKIQHSGFDRSSFLDAVYRIKADELTGAILYRLSCVDNQIKLETLTNKDLEFHVKHAS
jgi:hypothetical protein